MASENAFELSRIRADLVVTAQHLKELAARLEEIGERSHAEALHWADSDIALVLHNARRD